MQILAVIIQPRLTRVSIMRGDGGIRTHVPGLTDNSISSRARYDRFDTSPDMRCAVSKHTEYYMSFYCRNARLSFQGDTIVYD